MFARPGRPTVELIFYGTVAASTKIVLSMLAFGNAILLTRSGRPAM
jgi:hypothetical protein